MPFSPCRRDSHEITPPSLSFLIEDFPLGTGVCFLGFYGLECSFTPLPPPFRLEETSPLPPGTTKQLSWAPARTYSSFPLLTTPPPFPETDQRLSFFFLFHTLSRVLLGRPPPPPFPNHRLLPTTFSFEITSPPPIRFLLSQPSPAATHLSFPFSVKVHRSVRVFSPVPASLFPPDLRPDFLSSFLRRFFSLSRAELVFSRRPPFSSPPRYKSLSLPLRSEFFSSGRRSPLRK